ncbi:cupin domain-containing protein [Pseudoxanthomonas dokdonensis]|nr:cupin domain-containing protein [Pseudoxanthomonas dokdonensis]
MPIKPMMLAPCLLALAMPALAVQKMECAAGQEGDGGWQHPTKAVGEHPAVILGEVDLGQESIQQPGYFLRMRTVTVEPGGVIPYHSHGKRPGIFFMKHGQIKIYVDGCKMPLVLNEGDSVVEDHRIKHFARNETDDVAILLVADIHQ